MGPRRIICSELIRAAALTELPNERALEAEDHGLTAITLDPATETGEVAQYLLYGTEGSGAWVAEISW